MMCPAIRRFTAIVAILLFSVSLFAQPGAEEGKKPKPYRVLTAGKQVTIKSTRIIKNIMVWTASGHRIVEQRDLNLSNYSFNAVSKEKVLFLMIQYEGMKPYTEKIGVD